jgi:hypothetical protein
MLKRWYAREFEQYSEDSGAGGCTISRRTVDDPSRLREVDGVIPGPAPRHEGAARGDHTPVDEVSQGRGHSA